MTTTTADGLTGTPTATDLLIATATAVTVDLTITRRRRVIVVITTTEVEVTATRGLRTTKRVDAAAERALAIEKPMVSVLYLRRQAIRMVGRLSESLVLQWPASSPWLL